LRRHVHRDRAEIPEAVAAWELSELASVLVIVAVVVAVLKRKRLLPFLLLLPCSRRFKPLGVKIPKVLVFLVPWDLLVCGRLGAGQVVLHLDI
jgi:hypothetical protein